MDFDQWAERSAIMEFCGGMSRFEAETLAAQEQGVSRHDAISFRDSATARHHGAADAGQSTNDMPGVQRAASKENGPMPIGDIQAGWGGRELLALRLDDGGKL